MSLQISEIDGGMATFGSTHPSRRGDKVGYESCPDRSATQVLSRRLEQLLSAPTF